MCAFGSSMARALLNAMPTRLLAILVVGAAVAFTSRSRATAFDRGELQDGMLRATRADLPLR
jgi:hypothetical protein